MNINIITKMDDSDYFKVEFIEEEEPNEKTRLMDHAIGECEIYKPALAKELILIRGVDYDKIKAYRGKLTKPPAEMAFGRYSDYIAYEKAWNRRMKV